MRLQFVQKGSRFVVRGLHGAPSNEPLPLRLRIESEHFYRALASRPGYYVGKVKSVHVEDASKTVRNFLNASNYTLDNGIVIGVAREASQFSSTTIKALLLKIHSWMLTGNKAVVRQRCMPATVALTNRAREVMESEQSLELEFTLADLFYRIHAVRLFAKEMVARQSTALKYLTETDFIQHLFFSIPTRSLQPDTRAAVPIFVENVFDKLDVEEAGIVCFALYSGQYRLTSVEHSAKIVDVLERHKGPISDATMGMYAKYLRYISHVRTSESAPMQKFLNVASRRRSEWSLSTHLRIANVGSQAQICNEDFVRSAVPKVMEQLNTCRIKDLAVCLFINAYFDFKIDPNDAEAIIQRLRNENLQQSFHQWLVKATFSLAVMGYYDEQLLIESLDQGVIDFATTHQMVHFELYALFNVCSIMFPHLLKDKVLLRKEDMKAAIERITQAEDSSKRFPLDLQNVRTMLHEQFHVETRVERTLDLFPQPDIRIGDNLVIVLHTRRFYIKGAHLRGFRRFRTDLLKAAKYDVVELHKEFFEMTVSHQVKHLQAVLAGYLT